MFSFIWTVITTALLLTFMEISVEFVAFLYRGWKAEQVKKVKKTNQQKGA